MRADDKITGTLSRAPWIASTRSHLAGFPLLTWGLLYVAIAPAAALNAQTPSVNFQSREDQTSLLELYTSEGCSSCPPAETWLSGLKGAPGLWKEFVPLAFHVDYWDYLGWRDPWASRAFSDRQRAYTQLWHGDSVYTPGFVLNGREWRVWSRQKDGPSASGTKSGVLRVSSADQQRWLVSFSPAGPGERDYEVHAALLGNDLISDVKAGENRGRRLNHDFVVVAVTTCSLKSDGDKVGGEFTFDLSKEGKAKHLALAVWVTTLGRLDPLQAVGGWLSH